MLEAIAVPDRAGPGRDPPDRVLADKAYGSRANRCYLRRRGIACIIPEKADQVRHRKNKGRAGTGPPDAELYRSATPPSNAALTHSSARPGRGRPYDKLTEATVHIAAINEWLRHDLWNRP